MNSEQIYFETTIKGVEGELFLDCIWSIEWTRDTPHEDEYRVVVSLTITDYTFIEYIPSTDTKSLIRTIPDIDIEEYIDNNRDLIKRKILEQ